MKTSLFFLLDHYPELPYSVADRYRATIDQCVEADELGYDTVWIAEHHFHQLGTAPNPAVLLAAIAARTTRLRVAPGVAVLPMRPALYTAENYAMVDAISGGRLNLGLGMGNSSWELAGVGVDTDERRDIYRAALAEIADRFEGAAAGEFDRESINVACTQQPVPPLFIASTSTDGAYQVGRAGSSLLTISNPRTANTAEVGDRVRAHRQGLTDAGIDPDTKQAVVVAFGFCAPTAEEAREHGGQALARLAHNKTGIELDPNDCYDQLTTQGTAVLGDPNQAATLIARFADEGISHLAFFNAFGGLPAELNTNSIRLLASAAQPTPPASYPPDPGENQQPRQRSESGLRDIHPQLHPRQEPTTTESKPR
ncbi:LLM class flavin-dependent oxidoreductase [Mycobacterium sp.]|uniref:LLM class flavin-dependent oxidoreductase n=1 Tax=Mycobacterium sp. TaxID=1785 RepID=UPI003BA9C3E5